jgi:hypothetical protein
MEQEERVKITDIQDPVERFVAFIKERDAIQKRREVLKQPWPWTDDLILREYRFTNIHREDDTVSKHYQKTVREFYGADPLVLPATVLYRWFNRVSTCDAFFNEPDLGNKSVFETYILNEDITILLECLDALPPPHVTGAYIINGMPGRPKGEGVIQYFHDWCKKPWREEWQTWWINIGNMGLEDVYLWLRKEAQGLGTFMTAQLVADLKYTSCLAQAPDWWTWAAPGPGSMRGLNVIIGREFLAPWNAKEWLKELNVLHDKITPTLMEIGIGELHNQDLQNCLCEFSKYTKVATGRGRPRQVFKNRD